MKNRATGLKEVIGDNGETVLKVIVQSFQFFKSRPREFVEEKD